MHKIQLTGVFLLVLINLAASAQQADLFTLSPSNNSGSSSYFDKAGKHIVTGDEFNYLYKKNHTRKEDFTVAKENEYLNLLINFKLKIAEAYARGYDTSAAFVKEYATYKEDLKKPWLAGADDLDRLTKEAYDRLKEEIRASHILVTVKPDASPKDTLDAYAKITAIRNRALAGEDFEKLAKEVSEDPSAKQNSGNLGYFSALQMVYPFEQVAYNTPRNGISKIVRTRFGYHVLKVWDRRPSRGEIEISHILLRTGTPDDAKVKNTIFEIYDQLKAGRPWDELCKEYSDDTNTKNTGGRLKPFGPGTYPTIPEFEQAAFALKVSGEISDPFQSRIGWHIVRLEQKIALVPYKEKEAALKRQVSRDERLQLSKTQTLARRKVALSFRENDAVKSAFFLHADSSLTNGKWTYQPLDNPEGNEKGAAANQEIFSLGGTSLTSGDFIKYVHRNERKSSLTPAAYLTQLYDQFVEEKIKEVEETKLASENPEYRMLLSEYKEGILLFEIMEKEVWGKASEDSIGQQKYYKAEMRKYDAGNRVEAKIYATPDRDFFDVVKAKAQRGDTLTTAELKRFKSVHQKKAYERGESKVIDRISWTVGSQEAEIDGMYYLVEVTRLLTPGIKTFQEARANVISDYQDQLEKKWVAVLRKKYKVQVNKKTQKAVIAELNK